jgi:hypothetical protein
MIWQIFQLGARQMIEDTGNWTGDVKWKQALMLRSKQKSYGNAMPTRIDPDELLEIPL